MIIRQTAVAGTLESSDVMVTIRPASQPGLTVDIQSNVLTTFGDQIRATTEEVLAELGVADAEVSLNDKGAIDCVIRARVQAAACRASGEGFNWKGEDR